MRERVPGSAVPMSMSRLISQDIISIRLVIDIWPTVRR
ncbi:hypothetical protein EVA_17825 [gut metagenome]|uniref:Uncharacterized protein n=1 Tax=gut metagenome TaxID=749906 RepID=J9FI34_9ZZZZ